MKKSNIYLKTIMTFSLNKNLIEPVVSKVCTIDSMPEYNIKATASRTEKHINKSKYLFINVSIIFMYGTIKRATSSKDIKGIKAQTPIVASQNSTPTVNTVESIAFIVITRMKQVA